jgi:cytochrome b561
MGYGTVSRLFHWVTVVLVLIMIPVGLLMIQDIPRPLQDSLFILHKGLGPLVLLVVLARLAWRVGHPAPPLPTDIPEIQRRAARAVHAGLYVFLIIQAVSGYVRVTTGGFPIEALRALGILPLFSKAEGVAKVAETVHAVSATILILLIAMHIAAASYHGLVRRDGVVGRMWPPIAPHPGSRAASR